MERTPLFYLANLGSEINRVFSLKEKGLIKESDEAHSRSMDIIEILLKHPDLEGRTQEIEILKNYLEQSLEKKEASYSKNEWQRYFSPYAMRLFSVIQQG